MTSPELMKVRQYNCKRRRKTGLPRNSLPKLKEYMLKNADRVMKVKGDVHAKINLKIH